MKNKKSFSIHDKLLAYLIFFAFFILLMYFSLLHLLPPLWHTPGSPVLYIFGVVGSLFLSVSMVFLFLKRTHASKNPVFWFNCHVVTAIIGSVLVTIHSSGHIRYAPALLLVALLGLTLLGIFARFYISKRNTKIFASKVPIFQTLNPDDKEKIEGIIQKKEELLFFIEPDSEEGTFSLCLKHWIKYPVFSIRFYNLVRKENSYIRKNFKHSFLIRFWRSIHISLSIAFFLGLFAHIIVVTFFAEYVSGGSEIYWWHMSK
ncbi:MAG: hypothetical protein VX794_01200 [Nitrospinota bacterium]|nr:hypothetical protein [Nitrospinota bacterium]